MSVAGHTVRLTPLDKHCDTTSNRSGRCVQVDGQPVNFQCVDEAPGCLRTIFLSGEQVSTCVGPSYLNVRAPHGRALAQ